MTWTKLDDNWTRDRVIRRLDHQARWHYLCMIQECSAGKIYDGVLDLIEAERCSDAADPTAVLAALIGAGLVENVDGERVKVVRIDEHVPSADLRRKLAQDKVRAARYRKHKAGDHSECDPDRCPASRDASRQSSRDARDSDGDRTGLDVTGSTTPLDPDDEAMLSELTAQDRWGEYHETFGDDAA